MTCDRCNADGGVLVTAGRYNVGEMRFWKRPMRTRQVTLYGKPGCHLCEDAHALLVTLSRRYPLVLREVDIRDDPTVFRAYDIRIPVIEIDGQVTLEAPISERSLVAALR